MMKKVMIVEDEELILQGIRNIIDWEALGLDVVHMAHDGVEALKLWEKEPVHIVVTDISMPVMDGLEAARSIRALNREDALNVPIIAMTANAYDEDKRRCLEAGMNAHMAKPIDVQRLLELVENVVGRAPEKENGKTGNVGGI